MATIECTRRLTFCAGHRVKGHENKCAHLHGHNYVVHVTAQVEEQAASGKIGPLDQIGRVIDFSVLKAKVGGWLEEHWDHGFILHGEDAAGDVALTLFEVEERKTRPGFHQKRYYMACNPTAENMANHLLRVVGPRVLEGCGVKLTRVVIEETENCSAEAKL